MALTPIFCLILAVAIGVFVASVGFILENPEIFKPDQWWILRAKSNFEVEIRMLCTKGARLSTNVLDWNGEYMRAPSVHTFNFDGEFVHVLKFDKLPRRIMLQNTSFDDTASIEVERVTLCTTDSTSASTSYFYHDLMDTPTFIEKTMEITVPFTSDGRFYLAKLDKLYHPDSDAVNSELSEEEQEQEQEAVEETETGEEQGGEEERKEQDEA